MSKKNKEETKKQNKQRKYKEHRSEQPALPIVEKNKGETR